MTGDAPPTVSGRSDRLKTLDKNLLKCYSLSPFPSKAIVVWHCLIYTVASSDNQQASINRWRALTHNA